MTKEEFKAKVLDGYFNWCATHDRTESSWWLSLEAYAEAEYNRTYKAEKEVKQ